MASSPLPPSLFLSYARGDDEPFVRRLHADLVAKGFDVWFDQVSMPNRALTFLQEIRDAISARERLLVVIGPAAVESTYVRAEWRWAIEVGKAVTPVLRSGSHDLLPPELAWFDAADFRNAERYLAELERLTQKLADRPAPMGRAFGVPLPPTHFLARPQELAALKAAVLRHVRDPLAVTGRALHTGVQGMGGIGKTVLTAATVLSPEVRRAFPDGVLWVTLGQAPDLPARQGDVATALGDPPFSFRDTQQGRGRLGQLLADRACLIVLDDVWRVEHVDAFRVLGPSSRLLLTTRDARIVRALGASDFSLDVLSEEGALRLLAMWSSGREGVLPARARDVARECGYLPLALAMVGARARGDSNGWEVALTRLRNADLARIREQFPDYPYPDLLSALQVSVDALATDGKHYREAYIDLGVFPEDTAVHETVVSRYLASAYDGESEARDIVRRLVDLALLRRSDAGYLSLHDLQGDYVRKQVAGGRLQELHVRLLRTLEPLRDDSPDYAWRWVAWHLLEAGKENDLKRLLVEFRYVKWKLKVSDIGTVLGDFDRVPLDRNAAVIRTALSGSAHVLAKDKVQLASQLSGRLVVRPVSSRARSLWSRLLRSRFRMEVPLERFVAEASSEPGTWFRPLKPTLIASDQPLLRTYPLEGNTVTAIAPFPDGRTCALGLKNGGIWIFDLDTGSKTRVLSGIESKIVGLTIIPGESRLFAAGSDGTMKLWDLNEDRCLWTTSAKGLRALTVSATGRRILTGSYGGDLTVWDLNTARPLRTFSVLEEPPELSDPLRDTVGALVFLPNERHAVSGTRLQLALWDLDTGRNLKRIGGSPNSSGGGVRDYDFHSLRVLADGRRMVAAASSRMEVWDIHSLHEIKGFRAESHKDVCVLAGERAALAPGLLNAGGDNWNLHLWDLQSGSKLGSFKAHTALVTALTLLPDGQHALSGSEDGTLRHWHLGSLTPELLVPTHPSRVTAVAISPDGKLAASGSYRDLRIWDAERGSVLRAFKRLNDDVRAATFLAEGGVLCFTSGIEMQLVETTDARELQGNWDHSFLGGSKSVEQVAAVPNRRQVVYSVGANLVLWDVDDSRILQTFRTSNPSVQAVGVLGDGRTAWSASFFGGIEFWDLKTGQCTRSLKLRNGSAWCADIDPEGRSAVLGGSEGALWLWDLRSEQGLRSFEGHQQRLTSVHLLNGSQMISTSEDGTVRLWHLDTGENLATFTADSAIRSCSVSRAGTKLIVGEDAGRVHFLSFERSDLIPDPGAPLQILRSSAKTN